MERKSSYTYEDLIKCAKEGIDGSGNARLPTPNMLMMDRITKITEDTGLYGKGEMIAELDIKPDLWFFDCHFPEDPVMPGCLGLDAMWQLIGFFLGWKDLKGKGRALGVSEVKFRGQVLRTASKVVYEINIKRVIASSLVMGIADGVMKVDGKPIYSAKGLRVGLFTSTDDWG